MAGLPWFKVYAAETLSDEAFQGWDVAERGAWFTLICVAWREGSIPGDQQSLAKLLHLDGSAMRQVWSAIGSRFVDHPDHPGRLTSPRLEREREAAELLHSKKAAAGKNGAKSRWSKTKSKHGRAIAKPKQAPGKGVAGDSDQDRSDQDRTGQIETPLRLEAEVHEPGSESPGLEPASDGSGVLPPSPPPLGQDSQGGNSLGSDRDTPGLDGRGASEASQSPSPPARGSREAGFPSPTEALNRQYPQTAALLQRLEDHGVELAHARQPRTRRQVEADVVQLGLDRAEAVVLAEVEARAARGEMVAPAVGWFAGVLHGAASGRRNGKPLPDTWPHLLTAADRDEFFRRRNEIRPDLADAPWGAWAEDPQIGQLLEEFKRRIPT